jgi:hypothetical protein
VTSYNVVINRKQLCPHLWHSHMWICAPFATSSPRIILNDFINICDVLEKEICEVWRRVIKLAEAKKNLMK